MTSQNWGSWTPWTPSITASTTDPDLGVGATARGGFIQSGTIVHWWAQFVLGTDANPGSGFYQLPMPVKPIALDVPVGSGFCNDTSEENGLVYPLVAVISTGFAAAISTDPADVFLFSTAAAGSVPTITVADGTPFTWDDGDLINMGGSYEAGTS